MDVDLRREKYTSVVTDNFYYHAWKLIKPSVTEVFFPASPDLSEMFNIIFNSSCTNYKNELTTICYHVLITNPGYHILNNCSII